MATETRSNLHSPPVGINNTKFVNISMEINGNLSVRNKLLVLCVGKIVGPSENAVFH